MSARTHDNKISILVIMIEQWLFTLAQRDAENDMKTWYDRFVVAVAVVIVVVGVVVIQNSVVNGRRSFVCISVC